MYLWQLSRTKNFYEYDLVTIGLLLPLLMILIVYKTTRRGNFYLKKSYYLQRWCISQCLNEWCFHLIDIIFEYYVVLCIILLLFRDTFQIFLTSSFQRVTLDNVTTCWPKDEEEITKMRKKMRRLLLVCGFWY